MSLENEAVVGVTLVIRVIRSFPHRNIRNLVLKNVSLSLTTEELLDLTKTEVASSTSLPPPFRYKRCVHNIIELVQCRS